MYPCKKEQNNDGARERKIGKEGKNEGRKEGSKKEKGEREEGRNTYIGQLASNRGTDERRKQATKHEKRRKEIHVR